MRPAAAPEQPEEVAEVESIEAPAPEPGAAPEEAPPNTTIVACAECNRELRVPTDQGMVKVTCTECGLRWLYMPENAGWPEEPEDEPPAPEQKQRISGDLRTVIVITCPTCSQKLNVPVNRGTLNVTCPTCKASWRFTP